MGMKVQRFLTTLLAAGALLASSSEICFAEQTYRGATHCKKEGTGTYARWGGGVMNTSTTQELSLFCPVIKEENVRPSLTVGYFDRHTTRTVSCTVVSEEYVGETVYSYISTGDSSAAPDASFHTFGTGAPLTHGADTVYATCSVPRAQNNNYSLIMSFGVTS